MPDCPGAGDRINSYALVSYIADPLGSFLDRLRRELVPLCCAQSHVTILPPREIRADQYEVERQLSETLHRFPAFSVRLTDVEVFRDTSVIYIGISSGREELRRMHDRLNQESLAYTETYQYHPHITLAQDFPKQDLPDMLRLAQDRWKRFGPAPTFDVERLTFVQNTDTNRWLDLAEYPLGDTVLTMTG